MKGKIYAWFVASMLGMVIPWILFSVAEKLAQKSLEEPMETTVPQQTDLEIITEPDKIQVMKTDGSVVTMELDDYIVGVVLGEMPVSFDMEALKAQAVVARTYALKRINAGEKHPHNAVCMVSDCCQSYRSQRDYLLGGGTAEGVEKVNQAVEATTGQVLLYNGNLIEATYFSCSGGRTEDAAAVWGTDIPYLQAQESPGEEEATHYVDTIQFSCSDFINKLGLNVINSAELSFGSATYTDGGGVESILISGQRFDGITLRQKLGLRSTAFQITKVGDQIFITTRGFGHRVGMSQYGAEAMAVKGSGYDEILTYYYPGTVLSQYSQN